MNLGRVNTRGKSFRARAEARQREYRANVLGAGCAEWGHWLDETATKAGQNFVVAEAHTAARERAGSGKGVGARTFQNRKQIARSVDRCGNYGSTTRSRTPRRLGAARVTYGSRSVRRRPMTPCCAEGSCSTSSGRCSPTPVRCSSSTSTSSFAASGRQRSRTIGCGGGATVSWRATPGSEGRPTRTTFLV